MHELFHLKRYDHLVNVFQRVVEMLFFFNPAVRFISAAMRKEREICCDDMVLETCGRPLDYAKALYQLALGQNESPTLVPAAAGSNRGQLIERIQRILNPAMMKTNIREKFVALMMMMACFALVFLISGFSSGFSITQYNRTPKETIQASSFPSPAIQASNIPLADPLPAVQPDTIPEPEQLVIADPDVDLEEIHREIKEAIEEIDWEEIKKEMDEARTEVMEEIDWEEMKKELEAVKAEVMVSFDWDEIKKEIEEARREATEEIDWKAMKKEMEKVRVQVDSILQNIDFDFDLDMDRDADQDIDSDVEMEENLDL